MHLLLIHYQLSFELDILYIYQYIISLQNIKMSEQDLRVYYNYLFPFETLTRWLTNNNKTPLSYRELSFQYKDIGVQRYCTFATPKAMKNRMIDRHSAIPMKLDAGAIWNTTPQKQSSAKTVERQLIFDFDMNDYDDVRTCCQGKKVCVKCWKLLRIAVQIIQKSLEEDFGFTKLLFVFSGGRGLHIWVCDKRARELKDSVRKALVDYLQLITGNDKADSLMADRVISKLENNNFWKNNKSLDQSDRDEIKKFVANSYWSTHVQRSIYILAGHFVSIMQEQDIFQHQKCKNIIFKILHNRHPRLKDRVQEKWSKMSTQNVEKLFMVMVQEIQKYENSETVQNYVNGKEPTDKVCRLTFIEQQIMLSFLYPRIDHHVSTNQNHLLKLPFSVHPTSKNISIPLTRSQLNNFDPQKCIKIDPLLKQLEQLKQRGILDENENEVNSKETGLRSAIVALQEFISKYQ